MSIYRSKRITIRVTAGELESYGEQLREMEYTYLRKNTLSLWITRTLNQAVTEAKKKKAAAAADKATTSPPGSTTMRPEKRTKLRGRV